MIQANASPQTLADRLAIVREQLVHMEKEVPQGGFARLFRAGRSAAGLATTLLGGGLRGRGNGLSGAEFAAIERLVQQLGELKGLGMKAGQILGYVDPTLPEELRGLLSLLQTTSPATPIAKVREILQEELGARAEGILAGLVESPLAVASIGQVHRSRLPDGREVVVKVRHPGIEDALRTDFRAAAIGPAMAGIFGVHSGGTVRNFVHEAQEAMLEECDFSLEAQRQAHFGRLYRSEPTLRIPEVQMSLSSKQVLTTRYLPGLSLDAFLASSPSQSLRDRLGVALFSFYVGALYQHGLFHADPHPGNYAFLPEGQVVLYDFGCVRQFDREIVRAFSRLVAAVKGGAEDDVMGALQALGGTPPEKAEARHHVLQLLQGFFGPLLQTGARPMDAGLGIQAKAAMRDKRTLLNLALPGRLLFLFRLRFGLYAVLSRLGAIADWAAIESSWAEVASRD